MQRVSLLALLVVLASTDAFSPGFISSGRSTNKAVSRALNLKIPFTGGGGSSEEKKASNEPEEEKPKISLSSVIQLITAGAGSPFLGDYEGVDPETGNFMFSLEANNLVDEDGNSKQTQASYFENGWVSEEDMEKERLKNSGGGFKFPWQK
mmetsp:Transcript_12047/g.17445  ORF Transcript_12047/g.17445 Transcript_12047/m.17445 type:complete len:151 (+) Transcript_12047:68-520(+)|eukprot:CAMPEP_0195507438 /NCGR_PEP_ID=MMETSP0794_2-20130614/892_1 /TAXON_ID=515487 /ORGANISM="Stephanopyxis turris, Strain CCMP 815" /LENGTH=150 /DNA_ID=CAMNT_0040634121 /DNA_START=68 /DNA_END=520 /DNA_ORIENTATION=+